MNVSIFVLVLANLLVAIALIIALRKRCGERNQVGEDNPQPIFIFETRDSWFIDERSTDHTESIRVKNVGDDIRFAKEIEVSTIIEFRIMNSEFRESTRHYIEYDSFYGKKLLKFDPFTRQSEAYHSKENINSLDVLLNAPGINGNKEEILSSYKFMVNRFNLFQIEYEDLQGNQHHRYYKDNKEIDRAEYTSIKDQILLHITDPFTHSDTLLDIYTPLIAEHNRNLAQTNLENNYDNR